nr:MAG TPA: hypothetical protein [Caudoviricetes sp.]
MSAENTCLARYLVMTRKIGARMIGGVGET